MQNNDSYGGGLKGVERVGAKCGNVATVALGSFTALSVPLCPRCNDAAKTLFGRSAAVPRSAVERPRDGVGAVALCHVTCLAGYVVGDNPDG